MNIVLKYVGSGSLISIPARDLTEEDLKNIAWTGWDADQLVECGLYEYVENVFTGEEYTVKDIVDRKPKKRGK